MTIMVKWLLKIIFLQSKMTFKILLGTVAMVWSFAMKHDNLGSVPRTHRMEGTSFPQGVL